jgi:pimeloyl-ACP methyl ester carboxylesterase
MFKSDYPSYFYTSDKVRIFYNTNFNSSSFDPSRPVVCLVYGLLCSNYHFKYQIPFLEEMGYQILIHDYRFHYASSQDGDIETCTFKNIAKDLSELLESLQIKKIHLIGHSMGVNICLEFAKTYQSYVKSLTLMSGTVLPPQDVMFDSNIVELASPFIQTFANKNPKVFSTIWKTSFMNPIAQLIVFDGGFNTKQVEIQFIQLYMKKISELPKELFFHLLNIMRDHDIISHLEEIKIPTLIIGGDKDKIIPNYLQRLLKTKIPNSELYIVKNGSHVPQADFPEMINKRIHHFLLKKTV